MIEYDILIDSSNYALLSVDPNPAAINFVHECFLGASHIPAVNIPNYLDDFFITKLNPASYVEWSWDNNKRIFFKTNPEVVTDELRGVSHLAHKKTHAVNYVLSKLNWMRSKVATGAIFQELIYISKERQAQRFRDSGYDEKLLLELPYVVHYAENSNIPFGQAADEILLQAKLDHEYLVLTEDLRIEYLNRIKRARTPEELNAILMDLSVIP